MNIKESLIKAGKSIWGTLPLILGTMLLVSIISTIIPQEWYSQVFSKIIFLDSFIGAIIGSISAGTPITSYIFGGELLSQGVSLIAVTAFLVSWVTVGIVQLPAEMAILGKRFALWRNITAFILAILVAFITVFVLGVLAWI